MKNLKPMKLDVLLGVLTVVSAVLSVWLIFSITTTLKDAQLQMRAMPRSFLIDIVNTQNQISGFKQHLQQYLMNPSEQGLDSARNKQNRLVSRSKLLETSVARLHIPTEKMAAFIEELGYLENYTHDLGIVMSSAGYQLRKDDKAAEDLLMSIEDSMAFLYTEGNVLLQWQANNQISVLGTMSTTLTVLTVVIMIMFSGLIFTLRKLYQQRYTLQKLATEDPLTSLKNRRSFDDILRAEFARVKRTGGQLSLLILDLDHFKQFNDTYGHAQGDDALVRVAQVLRRVMKRQDDWAFRLGGEEFGCLMSTDSESDAKEIAELLRKEIIKLDIPHRTSPVANVLTASIGISHLPDVNIHSEIELYVNADDAMYEAKRNGRNQTRAGQPVPQHLRIVPETAI